MRLTQTPMFFVMFGLLGCTSLDNKFTPVTNFSSSKALVYVYRVPRFAGSAGSPYVCIDGQVAGEVVNGGYFSVQLSPGKHRVTLKSLGSETEGLFFNVRPGKTYYLRSDFSSLKAGTGGGLVGYAIWGSSADERKKILDSADTSAQEATLDASLLFVKQDFADTEISKNKEFKVPAYKKNYCAKSEKKLNKDKEQ